MANMRLLGNERDLYFCLNEYGKSNEKAARFLSKLRLYRNIAAAYPVNDFVKFIVDDTAIVEIYRSLPGGDEREAALKGILFAFKKPLVKTLSHTKSYRNKFLLLFTKSM